MPSYWENLDEISPDKSKFMIMIELDKQSEEFKRQEEAFKKTIPLANVIKIERIQNRRLWTLFQTELNLLKEKYGGKEVEVRYLYHGTGKTLPPMIYSSEEGFDMRFSSVGMWGRAVYFAVNSKYSH